MLLENALFCSEKVVFRGVGGDPVIDTQAASVIKEHSRKRLLANWLRKACDDLVAHDVEAPFEIRRLERAGVDDVYSARIARRSGCHTVYLQCSVKGGGK